jgi:hypothetical protein
LRRLINFQIFLKIIHNNFFYFHLLFQKVETPKKIIKNRKCASSRRLTRVFGGSIPGGWAGLFRRLKCTEMSAESIAKPGNILMALWHAVRRRLAQRVEYRARSARLWGSGGVAPRKMRRAPINAECCVVAAFRRRRRYERRIARCGVRLSPRGR